ncbi:DnaJ chaperone protein [Fadolivirus algeromassiliense]|jgi:DnaJ-class molecular chaperone|uniref:DnaJ chaperone protein n=1 Tax=Fadolivirus FV1/VV64 TaxID=3070911 RepID=A0A7D3UPM8_9VIRU|nr:DnaJ chaperone protein [Fadolivirus algeromassiliense]QKF94048.1 DnaJ chaperone protein [Fadolivirus FV1/VV64]
MNFYDILCINNNASKNDIRKAYSKLVKKYHPDKTNEPDAKEKFQEIQTAYEILYDDEKRKQYDSMTIEERLHVYDLIKQYFTDIKPQYFHFYDSVVNFIYEKEEDAFKNDINNFNIRNIFTRIVDKIKNESIVKNITKNSYKNYIDITENNTTINISLKDRYESLFKYGKVITDNNINEYIIPIYENTFVINDPVKGVFNLTINTEQDKNFSLINNYDLLHIKKISLSQYIYGGKIKIYLPNGEINTFDFDSCLEKKPVFVLNKKGLPKIVNGVEDRGDLYIYLTIEGINSINEDDVSQTYAKTIEETIKLLFPPIE